tara:strand:+ start:11942 stop:12385 length:444 start_codon:yes stop_codon:yes gene_type:complete
MTDSYVERSAKAYKRLRRAIAIDKDQITDELTEHAPLLVEVGEWAARSLSRRDGLKDSRDQARSRAEERARTALGEAKTGRVLVAEVESAAKGDEIYAQALEDYREATQEAATWENLLSAWRTRGSMIRDLANIYATEITAGLQNRA